jgi:hypothetical protein
MSRTGFSSINSKKYQTYIKSRLKSRSQSYHSTTQDSRESEGDVFDAAGAARGSRRKASLAAKEMENLSLEEENIR